MAICSNNIDVFKALMKKNVSLTVFDLKLFQWFAIMSIRFKQVNKGYLSLRDKEYDPTPASDLWGCLHPLLIWAQPEFSDYSPFYITDPLQNKYTPYQLAAVLKRTEMMSQLPMDEGKVVSNWIEDGLYKEELGIRHAADRIVRVLQPEYELMMDKLDTSSVIRDLQFEVFAKERNITKEEALPSFKIHTKAEIENIRLVFLAEDLRDEIRSSDYLFTVIDLPSWIEKCEVIKTHEGIKLPEYKQISNNIIIFPALELGRGAEGVVVLGLTSTGQRVAVKIIYLCESTCTSDKIREVQLYEKAYPDKISKKEIMFIPLVYEEKECCGIIMPCFEVGTLHGFLRFLSTLKSRNYFTYNFRLQMILEIAQELQKLHEKGIAHRDIKSSNILLQPKLSPIFIDFGFASEIVTSTITLCGTAEYIAPEVWQTGIKATSLLSVDLLKADVYSFSILTWEILTGKIPYSDGVNAIEELQIPEERCEGENILRKIVCGGSRPDINDKWEDWIKELLKKCWDAEPSTRPNMSEVVEIISTQIK